jgi:hypothetical protein
MMAGFSADIFRNVASNFALASSTTGDFFSGSCATTKSAGGRVS